MVARFHHLYSICMRNTREETDLSFLLNSPTLFMGNTEECKAQSTKPMLNVKLLFYSGTIIEMVSNDIIFNSNKDTIVHRKI